jgi:hypothetical protein
MRRSLYGASKGRMIMVGMRKEAVVTDLKIVSRNLTLLTEEKHQTPQNALSLGWDLELVHREHVGNHYNTLFGARFIWNVEQRWKNLPSYVRKRHCETLK